MPRVGVLATVALYPIGVPGALFLGILSGLLEFVPLVGPIVAAIPPLLLAFALGPLTVLWVPLAYVGIQQIESNLLEPLVMEEAASLHPATVMAAILVKELWFRRLEEGDEHAKEKGEDEEEGN